MSFYHDVKEHMSPSALAQWKNGRASFVASYFRGDKGPETAAMRGGTKIHALIEGGMINAKHVYEHSEQKIRVEVKEGSGLYFMGVPDSYTDRLQTHEDSAAEFVDYKGGKANNWHEKLPGDIKMMATAWLVWMQTGKPDRVYGYVEFIETSWDDAAREVVPVEGKETESMQRVYEASELEAFTAVILTAMGDVNAYFERWKQSSGEFVKDEDVAEYVRIEAQISGLEKELAEVGARIGAQMDFGGEENHETEQGTFFFRESKKWDYPKSLKINYLDYGLVLEDAEEIAKAAKAALAGYEMTNEPVDSKRVISFRSASARGKKQSKQ